MLLEHFRHDPVGLPLFSLTKSKKAGDTIQASYIDYVFRAFYLTMQDLEQLEMAKGELVPDGRNSIVATSLWFLGLESYLNTLLKLTCGHVNEEFAKYKVKNLTEKLTALLILLQVDDLPVKRTGVYNRIHEFTTFRNEVFHDRNVGSPVKFSKTMFSEIPINCNLVDVMQGLLIFLEVAALLRFSLSGLDTMPDIFIHVSNKAFTKKLDVLYSDLIRPSFEAVLAKHQLSTHLNLMINNCGPLSSSIFSYGDITAKIVADSPPEYYFPLNPENTSICSELMIKIVSAEAISPAHFTLGRYVISNE
ncbi:hypothetical protein A3860_34170 [Niastella vici]|uniref:Uncharacterized protein n=1 Tax=Niastella vici TaxID=1703345 RepID=A0A1V9FPY7_9BACT|nr:hypothetical protein [Niastella vici]OQP60425.1 hypothetical protein A3860_34170 [Niastella vici]